MNVIQEGSTQKSIWRYPLFFRMRWFFMRQHNRCLRNKRVTIFETIKMNKLKGKASSSKVDYGLNRCGDEYGWCLMFRLPDAGLRFYLIYYWLMKIFSSVNRTHIFNTRPIEIHENRMASYRQWSQHLQRTDHISYVVCHTSNTTSLINKK